MSCTYDLIEKIDEDTNKYRLIETKTQKTFDAILFNKGVLAVAPLSNFYWGPFDYDGMHWCSGEAAFQAQKTMDMEKREEIRNMGPGAAKRAGRHVQLRPDWEDIKDELMLKICMAKFTQNDYDKTALLKTGDTYLIETTTGWHDNYWGACFCSKCSYKESRNQLGKTLMIVRKKIQESPADWKYYGGDLDI